MSLNSRIKERREQLNITRIELADRIGVTASAIANYENAISSPKIEVMYRIFDALKCDANYLYQDEMYKLTYENTATPEEMENIIKKYRDLDEHGVKMVNFTLTEEWERSSAKLIKESKSTGAIPKHLIVKAAHNDHADLQEQQELMEEDLKDMEDNW